MEYWSSYKGAKLCFLPRRSVFCFSTSWLCFISNSPDSTCPGLLGCNSSFPQPNFKVEQPLRRGIPGQSPGKFSGRLMEYWWSYKGANLCFLPWHSLVCFLRCYPSTLITLLDSPCRVCLDVTQVSLSQNSKWNHHWGEESQANRQVNFQVG